MAVERSDRRVRYTKTVLKQSLLELMKDRPIGKITVTEICRLADVNRNTFYAHYKGPEELLSVIEAELYNSITDAIVRDELHTESLLYEVCTVIYDNGDLCRIIFSDNGDKAFLQRVMGVASERSIAVWKTQARSASFTDFDLLYDYAAGSSVSVIQAWIQGGFKRTPREIAVLIERLLNHGLGAYLVQ